MTFGVLYQNGAPTATDAKIIFHENGHLLINLLAPGFGQNSDPLKRVEAQAINEGVSDIFAANAFTSMGPRKNPKFNDAVIGAWAGYDPTNPPNEIDPEHPQPVTRLGIRRFDEDKRYPEDYWPTTDGHENSLPLSSALWDIKKKFTEMLGGEEYARVQLDRYIFRTIGALHRVGHDQKFTNINTFKKFAEKFLELVTIQELKSSIREAFVNHGIIIDLAKLNTTSEIYAPGEDILGQIELSSLAPAENASIRIKLKKSNQVIGSSVVDIEFLNKIGEFSIPAPTVAQETVFELEASYEGDNNSLVKLITIKPESSFNLRLNREHIIGGETLVGTVSLVKADKNNDTSVNIASNDPRIIVPSQVIIPKKKKFIKFTINTTPSKTPYETQISAVSAVGSSFKSFSTIEVKLKKITALTPIIKAPNHSTILFVELNGKAPPEGIDINFESNKGTIIPAPAALHFEADTQFKPTEVIATAVNTNKAVKITGTYGLTSKIVRLTVEPQN